MKNKVMVERLNLETNNIEMVESIGRVRFVGSHKGADLTNGKIYDVIGIHQNLLKLIDDTKDYYFYCRR